MTYLAVTAWLAGAVVSFNLLLTFLLIRRVNRQAERVVRRGQGPALPAGKMVPPLTVPTVSGGTYSLGGPNGNRSLVAFLSPGCSPCHDQIPELREYARTIPGGAARVLAVVLARDDDGAADLARELTGWASVTLEPPYGAAQQAFSVSGYPSFYVLARDGKVEAGAMTVRRLSAAAPSA